MRKLLVTRGLPGSGKSHALEALGLADFAVGADALRLQFAGPALTTQGRMAIGPEQDRRVWGLLLDLVGERMARGETLCVDATHPTEAEFRPYLDLARQHRYEIACLDFSEVPRDLSDRRNEARPEHRRVPPHAIDRIASRMAEGRLPSGVRRIAARPGCAHLAEVHDWLAVPTLDLGGYREVVHVGDVHGCHAALMALLGGGLRDDAFYVFVGDLCDRGEENGEVMRWVLDRAAGRDNVRFLWGNHEDHLHREALGLEPVSAEFAEETLPQLRAAGVTREELDRFCARLDDMILYRHGRRRVMVTHAGLSTVPPRPWMISARQCAHGTGHYEDDVDEQFERHAPEGWHQVHGHRNHRHREVRATARSFNLEGAVEHGGHLRAVVLTADGFRPVEAANPVFRPFRLRRHHRNAIVPPWMARDGRDGTIMAPDLRNAMAAHPEVRERSSASFPHVVSLNFSRKVFYSGLWDDVVVKARGLFVDAATGEIVARSYDKFFSLSERTETTLDNLETKLTFPLTAWVKENGYLGITGYDRRTDSLFVASKSTPDGGFAGLFRGILEDAMPRAAQREALKRFLRDTESSMVFEVIDPVNDPHMVEYDVQKMVLLDVIRRASDFEKAPYNQLREIGRKFGFETKTKAIIFDEFRSFKGWVKAVGRDMSKKIEGHVMEDASGFRFKIKTPFYEFWKIMRGTKDMILRERETGKPVRGNLAQLLCQRGLGFLADPGADFSEWCHKQDTEVLRADIITLRKAYEGRGPESRPVNGPGSKR